ncbi:hypothetical protein DFH06DRAFT_1130963 [Mycena polygramma]|nr:hypothetical protein DFH06DRAFT_1130963 [Mycena polygramma]
MPECHKLPVELLSLVLEDTVKDLSRIATRGHYFRTLLRLCRVCHRWRSVARSTALFWSHLDIGSHDNPDFVSYLLDISGSSPLRLRITLTSTPKWPSQAVIQAVLPHIPRARWLSIICATRASRHEVYLALRDVALQVTSLHLDVVPHDAMLVIHPAGSMHQLRALRLRQVGVPWGLLSRLHTIVLRDIDIDSAPKWHEWEALSESSPAIERVCLRNIGCSDVPLNPRPLTFAQVTHLDLFFGRDESTLTKLTAALHLPMLSSLKVVADSVNIVPAIISHGKTNVLLNLALRLGKAEVSDFHSLFVSAPLLQHLHASDSEDNLVSALCIPKYPTSTSIVCPALRSLRVTNVRPVQLKTFVEHRHTASDMFHQLMFKNGMPKGSYYESTLTWLQSRVVMSAHGPPFETAWVH